MEVKFFMNIAVFILSIIGGIAIISQIMPVLEVVFMLANSEIMPSGSIVFIFVIIASAVLLIIGGFMSWRRKEKAKIILWICAVLFGIFTLLGSFARNGGNFHEDLGVTAILSVICAVMTHYDMKKFLARQNQNQNQGS